QTGGTADYVHHHVVRAMMNGASGQEVINGTWNQGDVITKSMNYTVPVPTGGGPDMIWDSCNVVVLVYKVGSPLSTAAPIQQAVQMTLISPDYVAAMSSHSPDVIVSNSSTVEFSATLYNQGLMNDTYNITATLDGPTGWMAEFTTENGTFAFGELDSIQVLVEDSTSISIEVNPNYFNGSGVITLECASKNDPGVIVNVTFNVVTSTGVHLLVVDASEENYGSIISNSLDGFYEGRYGVVSREAVNVAGLDLSYFSMIAWAGGNSSPAFYPEEVNNLQGYLDQGGNLLLAAHNLGSDIFETGGQSQFAQSFFNNYLHSNYIADFGGSYFLTGYPGDPITDGMVVPLNSVYTRSPDQISPIDAFTTSIIQFGSGPNINSIKADNGTYRVVYFGFALEQLNDVTLADTLVRRSVGWLTDGIVLDNPAGEVVPLAYFLEQNYPNPFNPKTIIEFQVLNTTPVSIKVYDLIGREAAVLVDEIKQPGVYQVSFDGKNLASGVYFYKMIAGDFTSVKKMNLLK
ncbi:MAG: T9SS type A sorting domain-containing protein, partial [Ignavibacteriaceae bacterium]|nr:T9SS type A sorting domain-containing protein [Ignavibacteriaceae bacterium]